MHPLATSPPSLILASASPRRRELLALLGLPIVVELSRYLEPSAPDTPVNLAGFVIETARNKASEVAQRTETGIVIGADTIVTLSTEPWGVALGKPRDADDARRMLSQLAGAVHVVYTGVVLFLAEAGRVSEPYTVAVTTRVRFRELTDRMIADYIATGEPFDKAGAYGAQGYAAPFIEGFEGDFFNVVGLPLCATGKLLEAAGVDWSRWRTIDY